jgi:ABC-type Fe3+-siderophore transport system permease subunit
MQPRLLALIITFLPLIVTNLVFVISAYEGNVPWCFPYIDGCTTISAAGRSGSSIFVFRAVMIAYAVLLIWFWVYAKQWLDMLNGRATNAARIILWLGIIGALFLMVYIDFLGTEGEINRFMRRFGIIIYFAFTPFAQLLLLNQHTRLVNEAGRAVPQSLGMPVLRVQLALMMVILIMAIASVSLDAAGLKTDKIENIVEWNISLLMTLYFGVMAVIWKDFKYTLEADHSG